LSFQNPRRRFAWPVLARRKRHERHRVCDHRSGVSIVIVGTVATLGTAVKGFYTSVADALK